MELFELLDVPPVQGPALAAEQEGCEDDSTIDFHLCFQGYTMFAPQPVLESTEGCATLGYSCRDVVVQCNCVRQVASQVAKLAGAREDRITGHNCGSCRLVCGVRLKHHLSLFKTHGQTGPPSRVSKTVEQGVADYRTVIREQQISDNRRVDLGWCLEAPCIEQISVRTVQQQQQQRPFNGL